MLSLFFFNLLPLPNLDGEQLLRAVLDHFTSRDEDTRAQTPTEGMERGQTMPVNRKQDRYRWRRGIEAGVRMATIGLLGICAFLSLLVWAKSAMSD